MANDEPRHPADLSAVEEHFSSLVAGVQDYAIFLLSADGYVQSWNLGAERIKGYKAEEIIGKHFSQFYPEEAIAREWPSHELAVARREGRFEEEAWRIRKDGSRFWANVVISTLYDADHNVRGFLKITRDLTERKAAEEILRQSEARFRLLVDSVKDYAIFMLDPQGRVASWNSGAQRIKGYRADEIIGQHFSKFYSSEDVAAGKPQRKLEIAIERGSVEDEGWRVRKDGALFWANVVITAVYNDDEELVGFAKVTRDMTEKRKAEALELADKQKNEFLAMLAHEIRNPLAPIRNGLQLLKTASASNPAVQETTQMMERQLSHLVRMVDDLLDVSRIITGKMSFHKQPLELADVVHRAVEEAQPLIDVRGHELMLSLPARPIVVDADPARLSQVIANLLSNAAKYTSQPSQLWLSIERQGDEALIRVKDPGIGIPAELLPNVFNLFFQADNSLARSQGGLGIGLTVVKKIVAIHGGIVSATSAGAGQGSEFVVRLPVSHVLPAPSTPPTQVPQQGPMRRILVVDDNVDAAATISALLRIWGHDVETAFDGPSALEAVRLFRPEVVILDIGLPGMSGYDVAKQLRAEPSTQSVIIAALTGYGQESDRKKSFESGFDYHLTKPPDAGSLEKLLFAPRLRVKGELNRGENN